MRYSKADLLRVFKYVDGELFWAATGSPAGYCDGSGRVRVRFGGKNYFAHRIIYQMHFGDLVSEACVDHVDGDPKNNRIENLRAATQAQNNANTRKRANKGYKGVSWHKRDSLWRARIQVGGKGKTLGYSKIQEEAAVMYDIAATAAYGQYAATNFDPRFHRVVELIAKERAFQIQKWGNAPHEMGEWLLLMRAELEEAVSACIKGGTGRDSVVSEITQVCALGVACLEQFGMDDAMLRIVGSRRAIGGANVVDAAIEQHGLDGNPRSL